MSKVLNVFYGADRLPYKDQERQVHYPMVGNSFAGASLVDEIRFYAKDLGTENNVFVGIAKRPDGQRGYQVLTYGYDTELNEPYWTFNVAGWFTEKVGNVFVSLNVYQGGVDIEVDEDSGLTIVSGTPIIQATGSVVLSINYAPVMDNGYGAVPTIDVQGALAMVGSKVDTDYLTANYYNKTAVDSQLLLKADLSYVNGFVKTLEVAMDKSTYVLTFTCKDGTGTTISTQSIDLPLESVVVSGEYDNDTQSIILTLQNGNTITIPVSDLVDGLVDTTTFETAIQGIEDALDLKANANEVYTKDEVDTLLNAKADKTTTDSLQNQINDLNSRLTVVEEAIIGVDTLTFTALSYSAIPNVSDNLYPIIASGGLDTKEIKGNSFVHTQLVQNNTGSQTISDVVVTKNVNGSYTFNGTASANIRLVICSLPLVNGRKYLLKGVPNGASATTGGYRLFIDNLGNQTEDKIINNTYSGNADLKVSIDNDASVNFTIFLQLFDLTKDFGAGNEPATYDQAVSMYASKGIDITNYVEYTQGTLIDSKPVKLISRGYNLFDGEYEYGYWRGSVGDIITPYPYIRDVRAKTKIKVVGGKSYQLYFQNVLTSNFKGYVQEVDENDVIIKQNLQLNNEATITLSNETKYVYIYLYDTSETVDFSQNIPSGINMCFHLTGSRTGYAPYKAPIEYQITTEVLRSAGSVQDSAVSKRVVSVDLGTLDGWANYGTGAATERVVTSALSTLIKNTEVSALANITCSKLTTITYNQLYSGNNGVALNGTQLYVKCPEIISKTTNADIKAALSGFIINYELATPTEQTTALPTNIEIEKGGSLEVVYDNGYTTPADFVFDCAVYKPLE